MISRQKAVAFIVARLSSSRLPSKQFREVGGRTILQWIAERLRRSQELDEIVTATVAEKVNEPLRDWSEINRIPCFWYEGEVDDVTTRLRRAAEAFGADICLLVSADCPLVHTEAIDAMVAALRSAPDADALRIERAPDAPPGWAPVIDGLAAARRRAWQRADELSDRPELKEHQFPILTLRPDLFLWQTLQLPIEIHGPPHRFSVDTWADLEFMEALCGHLRKRGEPFELPNVLSLLKTHPELLKINAHVHQRGLAEQTYRVLMAVDAGRETGYGHLMRTRELALQLTERQGWPVTFLVDDERASSLLEKRGIGMTWGALGREPQQPPETLSSDQARIGLPPHDVLVIDIDWRRTLPPGWRTQASNSPSVVVINSTESWAYEADQIIVPEAGFSRDSDPKITGGLEYVILRREIRQAAGQAVEKNLDLLVYCHDRRQRAAIQKVTDDLDWSTKIIDGLHPDFPMLLAQSRFFLSGFGYSAYEALALGAIPITLPSTSQHAKVAERFYREVGLPNLVLHEADLQKVLSRVSRISLRSLISYSFISDGTHRVVSAIVRTTVGAYGYAVMEKPFHCNRTPPGHGWIAPCRETRL